MWGGGASPAICFCLTAFRSLALTFSISIICLNVGLSSSSSYFGPSGLSVTGHLFSFFKVWEIFSHNFFKYILISFSPAIPTYGQIGTLYIIPQISLSLFFICLSVCCCDCIICYSVFKITYSFFCIIQFGIFCLLLGFHVSN